MEPPTSAAQMNAFKYSASDYDEQSISSPSNASGTFNNLNNSLKVNQRKQKKMTSGNNSQIISQRQSNQSISSHSSFLTKEKETPGNNSKNPIQEKQNLPPPPLLIQKMGTFMQQKLPPPPILINAGDKSKSMPITQGMVSINTKINSQGSGNEGSPLTKKEKKEQQVIKEEQESQEVSDKGNSRFEDKNNIHNQDEVPMIEEDPYIIKVNLHDNPLLKEKVPKIPNTSHSLLTQAKFILYQLNLRDPTQYQLNELCLSQQITLVFQALMKGKEEELQKQINEGNQRNQNLETKLTIQLNKMKSKDSQQLQLDGNGALQSQNSIVGGTTMGVNDNAMAEEIKKLKEENQELKMRTQILEQDLAFNAQKAKENQMKYDKEIENLRSQLKGSQSEMFVKQQVEHKKLLDDNAVLMREVKILQDQLRDEQQKVIELFEDAQQVKEEIMKEMVDFEKTKIELDRIRVINRNLRKRLEDNSIDFSEMDNDGYSDEDISKTMNDDTLGDASRTKKKKNMVSVGVSRAESIMSLAEGFNQKLEELIEEKSRSIVNVLTSNQMSHYYNAYTHPYAIPVAQLNPNGGITNSQQQYFSSNPLSSQQQMSVQNQNNNFYNNRQNVIELSINESEGQLLRNESSRQQQPSENHISSPSEESKSIANHSASKTELQMLKHKIKEMRDKHHTQLQDSYMNKQSSQQSMRGQDASKTQQVNYQFNSQSQVLLSGNQMNNSFTQSQYRPGNTHLIHQQKSHDNLANRMQIGTSAIDGSQLGFDQDDQLKHQFKTPVFQSQPYQQQMNSNGSGSRKNTEGVYSTGQQRTQPPIQQQQQIQQRTANFQGFGNIHQDAYSDEDQQDYEQEEEESKQNEQYFGMNTDQNYQNNKKPLYSP